MRKIKFKNIKKKFQNYFLRKYGYSSDKKRFSRAFNKKSNQK